MEGPMPSTTNGFTSTCFLGACSNASPFLCSLLGLLSVLFLKWPKCLLGRRLNGQRSVLGGSLPWTELRVRNAMPGV